MKTNLLQKLAQSKLLLSKLESINFLNLNWSKLSNQDSLESLLQDDFKRELSRPLVESEIKERSTGEEHSTYSVEDLKTDPSTGRRYSMYERHAMKRMPFKW